MTAFWWRILTRSHPKRLAVFLKNHRAGGKVRSKWLILPQGHCGWTRSTEAVFGRYDRGGRAREVESTRPKRDGHLTRSRLLFPRIQRG